MKARIEYDDTHLKDWRYILLEDESTVEVAPLDGDRALRDLLCRCTEIEVADTRQLPGGWADMIGDKLAPASEKPKPKRKPKAK